MQYDGKYASKMRAKREARALCGVALNLKFSATRLSTQHPASLRVTHFGSREKFPASMLRCLDFFIQDEKFSNFSIAKIDRANYFMEI